MMDWGAANAAGRRQAADMIATAQRDKSGTEIATLVAAIRHATADESGRGPGFLFQIAAAAAGKTIAE